MYKLSVENEKGDILDLFPNPNYATIITGLNPPNASINTSSAANFDGSKYNNSKANERNIVITIYIYPDVEKNRLNLYKYFKSKKNSKIYYSNSSRNIFVEGYVESFEVDLYENPQKAQISLICPDAYLSDINEITTSFFAAEPCFEFPFSIDKNGIPFSEITLNKEKSIVNVGDVETGMIIDISAIGTVLNPKIYNTETNEYFILNLQMDEGDRIIVNTNEGQKAVTLTHLGETSNVINKLEMNSTWFKLNVGDNLFLATSDEYPENMISNFKYISKYEGV